MFGGIYSPARCSRADARCLLYHQAVTRMEWRPVLDDLRLLGTTFITLTGGDPMCHPEFSAIARDVRDRAFALIIFTNGMLIDAEVAKSFAGLSRLRVDLSLHGATPAAHDEVTDSPDRSMRSGMRWVISVMRV